MAIPRGYRRGSGGFLQPRGQVNTGPSRSEIETASKAKYDVIQKKITASFKERQADHERIMAGIAKSETDTFKRINDALTASREVDAKNKDKLGNAMPPSAQTNYLESQLAGHLTNRSQRGQRITPGGRGTDPSQYTDGVLNTPVPQPKQGQAPPILPPIGADPTATEPGAGPAGPTPEILAVGSVAFHKTGAKLEIVGPTRQGTHGQEYLVRNDKGEEAWVPRDSFRTEEEQRGGGAENLLQHFAPKWQGADPDAFNPGA
jgi:hypothetical protein